MRGSLHLLYKCVLPAAVHPLSRPDRWRTHAISEWHGSHAAVFGLASSCDMCISQHLPQCCDRAVSATAVCQAATGWPRRCCWAWASHDDTYDL
jgi:hypothetical protein